MKIWDSLRVSEDVLSLNANVPIRDGESAWVLCIADVHFDSVKCQRDLLLQHLNEAADKHAAIIIVGDWFDVMQGKYDPRKEYKGLRPEYVTDIYKDSCYLDDVVEDTVSFLEPFSPLIKNWSDGNHEVTIKNRLQTDLTQRAISALQYKTKSRIHYGYEAGAIQVKFTGGKTRKQNVTGPLIGYDHGEGLKADVAKERWLRDRPDVDIMITGHYHTAKILPQSVIRYSPKGHKYFQKRYILSIPGYKNEGGEVRGWPRKTKGVRPTPCGGIWLEFWFHRSSNSIRFMAHETSELR